MTDLHIEDQPKLIEAVKRAIERAHECDWFDCGPMNIIPDDNPKLEDILAAFAVSTTLMLAESNEEKNSALILEDILDGVPKVGSVLADVINEIYKSGFYNAGYAATKILEERSISLDFELEDEIHKHQYEDPE